MSLQKINAALVSAYKALPITLPPTAYEVREFTPPPNKAWAAVVNMPADKVATTLGDHGYDEMVGVFQIDFNVPENTGTAELHNNANAVLDFFVPGRRISYLGQEVSIRKAVPSTIRRNSNAGFVISVSVYWRALVIRPLATT